MGAGAASVDKDEDAGGGSGDAAVAGIGGSIGTSWKWVNPRYWWLLLTAKGLIYQKKPQLQNSLRPFL